MATPTMPNAPVTLVHRMLDTAKVRFGISTNAEQYAILVTQNGAYHSVWVWDKAVAEKGSYCEVILPPLTYSITYELTAFGTSNNEQNISPGTEPATLTIAPQYPSFDFSQSGTTVTATLKPTFNLNWSFVVCGIYKDNVLIQSFSITSPNRNYGITGLPTANTQYQLRAYTVYNVNGTLITSVNGDGNLGINTNVFLFQGPRPNNYTWDNPKVSGGTYNLTAVEWNNYLSRLEQFITYLGADNFIPVYVISGEIFYSDYMNHVIQFLILYLWKTDLSIFEMVLQGYTITAALLNRIVTEMNKF